MRIFLPSPPSDVPGRTPLLSLAYLAAALQRAGHTVAVRDATIVSALFARVDKRLHATGARHAQKLVLAESQPQEQVARV